MSWDCCTPTGECQRGHGCPAGDKACAQTSGVARIGKRHPLRRVMLDAGSARPTRFASTRGKRLACRLAHRLAQLAGAAAVVAIWVLATATTSEGQAPRGTGPQQCTSWESQA